MNIKNRRLCCGGRIFAIALGGIRVKIGSIRVQAGHMENIGPHIAVMIVHISHGIPKLETLFIHCLVVSVINSIAFVIVTGTDNNVRTVNLRQQMCFLDLRG